MDASSGEQVRRRLSRAGNPKRNHVLHIAAAVKHHVVDRDGLITRMWPNKA